MHRQFLLAITVLGLSLGAPAQSIFDEGTFNRSGSAGHSSSPPARGYRGPVASEQPTIVVDDASYLFPPIPWDELTRGVVKLTRAQVPATQPAPIPPGFVPQPDSRALDALRRRYAPLVRERDVKDYEEVYGNDERRAEGNRDAMMTLAQTLRAAAKELANQPEMRRYVSLRAFALARACRAPLETLGDIAREFDPMLEGSTPAILVQRAELYGALADAASEAALAQAIFGQRRVEGARRDAPALIAAARAHYDLALWQLNHNYLEQVPESLRRAEGFARSSSLDDVVAACSILKQALEARAGARARYVKLAGAASGNPTDAKANADLAMFLLTEMRDVASAAAPAGKSGDPELMALASALASRDINARNSGVGMALASLIEHSAGKEKAALAALAIEFLDAYVRKASPADREYTKARLYLSRFRPLVDDAPVGGLVAVSPPATDSGRMAVVGPRNGGVLENPVFTVTTARRIVYLLDGSGSMMNKYDTLRQHTRRAIDSLQPSQEFNILIFTEDRCLALSKSPIGPSVENKRKTYDFLDKSAPHGSSDPIVALQAAFNNRPEAIYLLTDGDFPNNQQVIEEIRRLNRARAVKIHTIAFMDRGEAYEKLLRQIAGESGGSFRFVSDAEAARPQ